MTTRDLPRGARVPVDRTLGLRVLIIGLMLVLVALGGATLADLGAVVPVDGAPLRSIDGLIVALVAVVPIAALSAAYWPVTQAELTSLDRRSSGRLDDVGASACLFWAPVVLPAISVVVGRGERLATGIVASTLTLALWGLAEWVRRHMLVAGEQRPAEPTDKYRRGAFFRPGFWSSLLGVSLVGAAVALYDRELSAGFLGYWLGVSVAVVSAFTYVPQLVTWWTASDRAELALTAAAVAAACGLVVPAYLPHEPSSGWIGALCVAPFVVVMELWRRAHTRAETTGERRSRRP